MEDLFVDAHCVLRAARPERASDLFLLVDAERGRLREYLPWVDATRREEDTAAFLGGCEAQRANGTSFDYLIEHRSRLAGIASLRVRPEHRSGELGYWLRADLEGRGIMTACCRRLLAFGFEYRDLHRIVLAAAVSNRRSRAVAERLGMVHEATLKEVEWVNDRFVDHALYRLLRTEWARAGSHQRR